MNKILKQAFTLIELLVVIAIIGILSGLIVVSMGGVTQKANIAKSQVFSNSLRNALMLNLVAEYKLDGNAMDSWKGKDGTIHGMTASTDCVQGTCYSFTSASDYISIPDNSVFNFGSKMTVMLWAKGSGSGGEKYLFSQYGANQCAYLFAKNSAGGGLTVYLYDNGIETSGHFKYWNSVSTVFDDKWHLVGFTWNNGTLSLYVDGNSIAYTSGGTLATNSIFDSNASLVIGGTGSGGSFVGSLDEVRLYNESIPISQIKEQYYSGLNSLLAGGSITRGDYNERLSEMALR